MSMTPDELAGMVNEELKAELAALRAVAVAVRNADWYDVEPGMEVTKTICLNSSRWEYIMELVEVAEAAGLLPDAQADGVAS